MKGDFSRWTFNPDNHFTRVLMQQGRVQLDADWNEQVAILLHTMRQMVSDMMGPHGTWDEAAFKIRNVEGKYEVNQKGRYYAEGVLVDTATDSDNWQEIDEAGDNKLIYLDVWERHLTYVEADEVHQPGLREVALKGADTTTRAKVVWRVRMQGLSSVTGLLDNLQTKITTYQGLVQSLDASDELPTEDFTGFSELVEQLNQIINAFDTGSFPDSLPEDNIYSDVITPLYYVVKDLQELQDETPNNDKIENVRKSLNDVIKAFDEDENKVPENLPENEIYSQVITPLYNVIKALQALEAQATLGDAEDKTITRLIKEHRRWQLEKDIQYLKSVIETEIYNHILKPTLPLMRASTDDSTSSTETDSCIIPPDAAYTGPENQLYRVEIHEGGKADQATFKWSRENGTVIFLINPEKITPSGNEVTVEVKNFGRGTEVGLVPDDWVELTYDSLVESLSPGQMLQVTAIDPVTAMVTLKGNSQVSLPDAANAIKHPILRRWDQGSKAISINTDTSHALEKGIHITFGSGTYRTGDYWLIPARTATRDIEWPADEQGNPKAIPPHGIEHHYAPLAIISDGEVIDCRRIFEHLGQPVLPKPVLP